MSRTLPFYSESDDIEIPMQLEIHYDIEPICGYEELEPDDDMFIVTIGDIFVFKTEGGERKKINVREYLPRYVLDEIVEQIRKNKREENV